MGVIMILSVALADESYAALSCDVEAGSSINVVYSGFRLNRRIDRFVQTVAITNTSATSFEGPLHLVLQNLTPTVTLTNGTGTADCNDLNGSPYIKLEVGNDNLFTPGKKIRVVLQFQNPNQIAIRYTARVFAGTTPVTPLTGVTVDPDGFPINTPTPVSFTIAIPYTPGGSVPAVMLEQVSQNGTVIAVEGAMVDNGDLSLDDEIEGDGVFSLRKIYTVVQPGDIRLRIKADVSGQLLYSDIFTLTAFTPITEAESDAINNAQKSAQQLYQQLLPTKGEEQALADAVNYLKGLPIVKDAGISEGGSSIWIKFTNDMEGVILTNPPGTRGGAPLMSAGQQLAPLSVNVALSSTTSSNVQVQSKKVLILSPFRDEFGSSDEGTVLKALYENHNSISGCPTYDIAYLENSQVGVGSFKALGQYGIVHIATHGTVRDNQVVVLTKTSASAQNKKTYQADLDKGKRLVIATGNTEEEWLAAKPAFFTYYIKSMPSSLVFFSSCYSTFNDSMSNALRAKGAKAYLGFSDLVPSSFAYNKATYFHEEWVEDSQNLVTTGEVFNNDCILNSKGVNVCWNLLGANDLEAPPGDQLQNGDFEAGALGVWSAQGDGRVVTQLGIFSPTQDNYAGIFSTGLGFSTDSGSIGQKVCIPANAQTLTFDWNFSSEEFRGSCGSIFQDFFRVDLTANNGATTNFFHRKIDDLCATVFRVPFSFDQGDVWSTGWKSTLINISAFAAANAGKPVTIKFSAGDIGDSIYDTAILLDNIEIK